MKIIDGADCNEQYEILEKWQEEIREDQRKKCISVIQAEIKNIIDTDMIDWTAINNAILNAGKSPEGEEKEDE